MVPIKSISGLQQYEHLWPTERIEKRIEEPALVSLKAVSGGAGGANALDSMTYAAAVANLQRIPAYPSLCRSCSSLRPSYQPSNSPSPSKHWSTRACRTSVSIVAKFDSEHLDPSPVSQILLARTSEHDQNHGDPVSQSITQLLLPGSFDKPGNSERTDERKVYRRRVVRCCCVEDTDESNELCYATDRP